MDAFAEAQYVIEELTEVIENHSGGGGNISVLQVTTHNADWIGETITATNGVETVTGTLTSVAPALTPTGYCTLQVHYIGSYNLTVDDITEKVIVMDLGEVKAVDMEPYHIYGYKKAKNDSNPYTRVTYTDGAENFTPLTRDFEEDTTDLGSWEGTFILDAFRPLMLSFSGDVVYELDHQDQRKRLDGQASDISNTSFNGNAMVGVKTLWFYRYEDTAYEYVKIADKKIDSNYKAHAHTANDGETILDEVYLPMFEGASINGKVRSLAGQTPMNSETGSTEKTQIEANGSGWQFDDHSNHEMIRDVLTLLGKSTNGDAVFGKGHNSGGSGAASLLTTGTKKDKGMFSCKNNNDAVKVLWLENYWGDRWDRTYGAIYDTAGVLKIKMFPPYNTDGTGYRNTGVTISGTSGGYISETTMTEYGMLPKVVSGSESTFECDGCWWNTTQVNFSLRGGCCDDGSRCGFSSWLVYALFSNADWPIGPSLSYKRPVAA